MTDIAWTLTVDELAQRVAGSVEGDRTAVIRGVSSIEDAEHGDIVFAENARFLNRAAKSPASAIVAFLDATTPDKPLIKVDDPRRAFSEILELFKPGLNLADGVHPTAVVADGAILEEGVSIGPNVTISENARVGARAIVMAGSFIGEDCVIGADCMLYANVTLYHGTRLGDRVIIHSGAVIGADGFGYMRIGDRSHKVPQIGIVDVGDDVEVGANTTIDRAKTERTVIGARTKIDNLVQIGHNCKIGEDCVIVSQVGIAGSTTLGNGVVIAGQAGLHEHITVGDGVTILGQAAVFGDVAPGLIVSGYPARPHMERQRQLAAAERMPEFAKRVRELEKSNAKLVRLVEALAEKAGLIAEQVDAGAEE